MPTPSQQYNRCIIKTIANTYFDCGNIVTDESPATTPATNTVHKVLDKYLELELSPKGLFNIDTALWTSLKSLTSEDTSTLIKLMNGFIRNSAYQIKSILTCNVLAELEDSDE